MAIDFNQAQEQYTGGNNKPIPPGSLVPVMLTITYPQSSDQGSMPGLTRSRKSSMEYLNCQLVVTRGQFEGKKIYHNFNLAGASTDGQRKAIDISMSQLRAIVEASQGINPKDHSPQANQARVIQSWTDLDGRMFFIEVDCQESEPNKKTGKKYINNTMKRCVTIDDPLYQQVTQAGEMISNNPIPEVSNADQQPQSSWGGQNTTSYEAPKPSWAAGTAPAQGAPAPAWGQQPPNNGGQNVDKVPF